MIIKIPNNNLAERKYIIDILFKEFLGLSFQYEISEFNFYIIEFDGKELIIEDHFFNKYPKAFSYLNKSAIPLSVAYIENQFIPESNIPVIFGNESLLLEEKRIVWGNDIFAASFFMLTRWEEYVNMSPDQHMRFSAKESLAYKFAFLHRPIVNEYVETIWNMLLHLGFKGERKKNEYEFVLTHDVDYLRYYDSLKSVFRKVAGNVIRRKNLFTGMQIIKEYINVQRSRVKDPYDTFDWIMDLSDEVNVKSKFYFMSSDKTDQDNRYDINSPLAKSIIQNIIRRNHEIGFHPSYESYNNSKIWKAEKERLEIATNMVIEEGRQHYLRFEVPLTWNIWNQNNMKKDLSLSYADKEGFRCGVCYEFSVFDFISRSKLKLKELPLIVMEASFVGYQRTDPEEMVAATLSLIKTVKKYNGKFVFLWHNSSFNISPWNQYDLVYQSIVRGCKDEKDYKI